MPTTPSNTAASVLRTLHSLQRQLAELKERLDRGPRHIKAAETNVRHREEVLTKTKAESKALRMAADQKQLQLKSGEDKVKDLRRKLNAAATNREYQALLEQIAADEMANSVLADEILEAMEKSDDFHKNIIEAEAVLKAAQKKAEEVRAEVTKDEPALKADIAEVETKLRAAEANLPDDARDLYRRIVRQKGEDALAVVENQCCGGCNQQVPLNLCSKIMLGQPVSCRTCGRLLYLPE
jgi:uncharacterized protein